MNILYKYCDQNGIKIIKTLELKLPYVSEVNDPLECLPTFDCPDDRSAFIKRYLLALSHKGISPPEGLIQTLNELYDKGEIQKYRKELEESSRKTQERINQKSCLLSVSKTAQNTVMWSHYSNKHSGIAIGFDFDIVFLEINNVIESLKLRQVKYSDQRPKINILTDFDIPPKAYLRTISTKSSEWKYEREFRVVFLHDILEKLQKKDLVHLKDFRDNNTWFLKLSPESIREVIFGLFTEDFLKQAVKNLIKSPELQHVKLYQAKESETYTLNLVEK